MQSFILRNATGNGRGAVTAQDMTEALRIGKERDPTVNRADPDNPARLKLSEMLEESGLSTREFARRVLGRDVRSLGRYLAGDVMPPELADQLMRMRLWVDSSAITIEVQR